ncbi:MAG: multi-sensor signal transduction histidine kinase [Sphingomonas bacterium]|nr:multi-sensor signal transduction histidine kinase [Sphingomonas bacterium]
MKAQDDGSLKLSPARQPRWRRRLALLRRGSTLISLVEIATVAAALLIFAASWWIFSSNGSPERLLKPPVVAFLLVANLVPVIGIMVLFARRIAKRRARNAGGGTNGRLHVRMVAMFSTIAAVPTLFVVIFASLLFQYGVAFWFSDSARVVLVNADRVAQAYVGEHRGTIEGEARSMAGDFRNFVDQAPLDDPRFPSFLAQQLTYRHLSEVALIGIGKDGVPRTLALANPNSRPAAELMPASAIAALDQGAVQTVPVADRMEARIAIDPAAHLYLYASQQVDPVVVKQASRAKAALNDYVSLLERSRLLQLQFNAALLVISLLIVAVSIWIAFTVADRLTRPISELVGAARRITLGDLTVRVPPTRRDEVGVLAAAFNRMTRRLQEQTGALVAANGQLDARRALTEAVLSGVSAGVISVDGERRVRLMNKSAEALLRTRGESPVARPLAEFAPELDALIGQDQREAIVQFASAGDLRTLAVTVVSSGVSSGDGHVLTFDDITQQLLDQRRAAWSDVARRIAHEIKNPLTPIQLAAERLQRRYGREVTNDPAIFEQLTQTIVRQVGDLRRMVDEFSSFARMPKPEFREEPIVDIARQALFLHEVAHTNVHFSLDAPELSPVIVCDRRLLGQALTNIVKNAVEAIQEKGDAVGDDETVAMSIAEEGGRLCISVADTGIGLPVDRERLTEPYMTTRARGTGLGLAIVKKIVEEHFGTIGFADRPGGGTIVRIMLDPLTLAALAGAPGEPACDEALPPELTRMRAG